LGLLQQLPDTLLAGSAVLQKFILAQRTVALFSQVATSVVAPVVNEVFMFNLKIKFYS